LRGGKDKNLKEPAAVKKKHSRLEAQDFGKRKEQRKTSRKAAVG
jgi:hypothetical protein